MPDRYLLAAMLALSLLSLGIYLPHTEYIVDYISLLQLTAHAVFWLAGCSARQVLAGCHAGAFPAQPVHAVSHTSQPQVDERSLELA